MELMKVPNHNQVFKIILFINQSKINLTETTFYRDKILDPIPVDGILKTFPKFGPNFEILMSFVIRSIQTSTNDALFMMSNENNRDTGTIGRRYPVLLISPSNGYGYFKMRIRFYENDLFGSQKQPSIYGHGGEKDIEMKLNEMISCIFQFKDGTFNWYINGQKHWTLDTENDHPYVIENMKLILGHPNQIDGSIHYIAVRADNGVNGESVFLPFLIHIIPPFLSIAG